MARSVARRPAGEPPSLYEGDPHAWYFEQARLLRLGRLTEIDAANIAEELEDMGRGEARELRSSLRLILHHLLKLRFQQERATKSWHDTIERERDNAELALAENPSLKGKLPDLFVTAYKLARREAARETGLPENTFPDRAPFAIDETLRHGFFPDSTGAPKDR